MSSTADTVPDIRAQHTDLPDPTASGDPKTASLIGCRNLQAVT